MQHCNYIPYQYLTFKADITPNLQYCYGRIEKRKTTPREIKLNLTLRKTMGCLHVFSMKIDWKYMELAARITLWHLRVEPSTARVTSQKAST
jgi:hypothetical protein